MNKKVLIITELGMTHNGSASLAKRLIDSAIDSGVDAVKFQMHIFDEESLPDAPSPKYFTSESRKEFFKSTSSYPCSYKEVGLNVIKEMRERYGLPIGLSDHTLTIYASLAAVTLGANIIERHFTIDKKIYGPDAKFSLVPAEMKNLVEGIRNIEIMLNNKVDKNDVSKFKDMKYIFEKSIVSKNNIYKNTIITSDLLDFKKPGDGIRADRIKEVIGKRAKVDIPKNIKILLEHLK